MKWFSFDLVIHELKKLSYIFSEFVCLLFCILALYAHAVASAVVEADATQGEF